MCFFETCRGLRRRISAAPILQGILALALACVCGSARAATLVDPALRFRTLTTPHFTIYFHQGEERAARRLSVIAEDTWTALRPPLNASLRSRTHVLLVDQTELANGWATPLPYDTIMVTATWPAGSEFIGLTDDWLRLVFTHEYTHILHLDRSEGWARAVRGVFGRVPFAFPNLLLPLWQIEGLAVYEESLLPASGRLHAGDFLAVEQTARREHALEPLDRVNGGLTDWPGGDAPYAYGAAFHEFLAEHYGAGKFAELAEASARAIPYTSSLAFKRVYGKSLGDLWREFAAVAAPDLPPGAGDAPTRLTHHGFSVSGPRFAPGLCAGCPPDIVYSLRTPDAFPTLNAIALDGTQDRVLTTRYLGSTAGTNRERIVFDQQEVRRNTGLYSDLYVLDRATGATRALTSESRLQDPDVSPDGTHIVCVRDANSQRDLVLVDADGTHAHTMLSEPDTQFDAPRWSPDGRSIVVARHRLGGQSEIVAVDVSTAAVRVVASDSTTRFVTPTWRPDGGAIIAAADFDEGTFNLYEFDTTGSQPPVRLTHSPGGATWPDVSPNGRTIVYVGYTAQGFDLFSMPYPGRDAITSNAAADAHPRSAAGAGDASPAYTPSRAPEQTEARDTATYSPRPTLKPTSWIPFFDSSADQVRFGAAVSGSDVLGYHGYALSATWLVTAPAGAAAPSRATPDWQAAYAYGRWRPVLFVSASRTTSFFAGPPTDAGVPSDTTAREYEVEAGVQLPFIHTRATHTLFASVLRSDDSYDFSDGLRSVKRTALRAGWQTSTAHIYGYSISPERGVSAGATFESVPEALGSSAGATTVTADARAYIAGVAEHHVLALRAAAGASNGSEVTGRTFLSGGGGPAGPPLSFASRALGLLRGFPADSFAGSHIAVVNADYRWPVVRIERGHGTLPIFLKTVHAAVFADAANTWTHAFGAASTKTSAGLELSADLVGGYSLPFTVATGAAWGHDGAHLRADAATFYVRVGRAF